MRRRFSSEQNNQFDEKDDSLTNQYLKQLSIVNKDQIIFLIELDEKLSDILKLILEDKKQLTIDAIIYILQENINNYTKLGNDQKRELHKHIKDNNEIIKQLFGLLKFSDIQTQLNPNIVYAFDKNYILIKDGKLDKEDKLLDLLLAQIQLKNKLFNTKITNTNFWFLLKQYSQINDIDNKEIIYWRQFVQIGLKDQNLEKSNIILTDQTIKKAFSNDEKACKASVNSIKKAINNQKTKTKLLTIDDQLISSLTFPSTSIYKLNNLLNSSDIAHQIRKIVYQYNLSLNKNDVKRYIYIPRSLQNKTRANIGLWDNTKNTVKFDCHVIDSNGGDFVITLDPNNNITTSNIKVNNHFMILTNTKDAQREYIKVKSITIYQIDSQDKEYNSNAHYEIYNKKMIQLELDSSKPKIEKYDIVDNIGLSKYGQQGQLFNSNITAYENMANDIYKQHKNPSLRFLHLMLDLYTQENLRKLVNERKKRNIEKIKEEFDKFKKKNGISGNVYGIGLVKREEDETIPTNQNFFDQQKQKYIIAKRYFDKLIEDYLLNNK